MSLAQVQTTEQAPQGPTNEDRKRALKHLAAGASLWGAGKGGEMLIDRHYEKKGQTGIVRAIRQKKVTSGHVKRIGGKFAAGTAATAGLPLVGYGLYNAVKPSGKVKDFNPSEHVLKPTARRLTLREAKEEGDALIGKSLTAKDTKELVERKERGRKLSLAAGTMGVAALGLRGPELARAASKMKGLRESKTLARIAEKEPNATKASNALGIAAIGTGSIGSFNYARQQRLEAKDVVASKAFAALAAGRLVSRAVSGGATRTKPKMSVRPVNAIRTAPSAPTVSQANTNRLKPAPFGKALPPEKKAEAKARAKRNGRRYPNAYDNMISGGVKFGKAAEQLMLDGMPLKDVETKGPKVYTGRRVWTTPTGKREVVYDDGPSHVSGLNKIRRTHPKTGAESSLVTSARKLGAWVRKDAFLNRYAMRISPEAEQGYKYLKAGRSERRHQAATSGAVAVATGAGAGLSAHEAVRYLRSGRKRTAALAGTAALASGAVSGLATRNASNKAGEARRWSGHMDKIEAKAKERESLGQYGRGRFEKSLLSVPKAGIRLRKPSVRRSFISTSPNGKKFTVRGTVR